MKQKNSEIKNFTVPIEFKKQKNGNYEFSGYASVFNVIDGGGDLINPGAFGTSIEPKKVKMLWQHDVREVLGTWTDIRSDNHGLYVKGTLLPEVQRGSEAIALLEAGAIDGLSIGYKTVDATYEVRDDQEIRVIKKLELWEVSIVTFPMNFASTIDAKTAAELSMREFERKLVSESTLSRTVARALMSNGYDGVKTLSESGTMPEEQALDGQMLTEIYTAIKENNQ